MMQLLAELLAALISGGTRIVLAVISWYPPLWLRVLAPVALAAVTVWRVRHIDRPVRR